MSKCINQSRFERYAIGVCSKHDYNGDVLVPNTIENTYVSVPNTVSKNSKPTGFKKEETIIGHCALFLKN